MGNTVIAYLNVEIILFSYIVEIGSIIILTSNTFELKEASLGFESKIMDFSKIKNKVVFVYFNFAQYHISNVVFSAFLLTEEQKKNSCTLIQKEVYIKESQRRR